MFEQRHLVFGVEQKRLAGKKRTGPRDRKILIIYMVVLFSHNKKLKL